jgi:hypothetical protein
MLFQKGSLSWLAKNMDDIKKLAMSIIFIVGLLYTGADYATSKFVTRLEASNYALKENVARIDMDMARTQITVLQNELFNAKKARIDPEDKVYYRSLDKRVFMLKIKLRLLDAKEADYVIPSWLQE